MIINLRGTSGSGKSTIIRKVMERVPDWKPRMRLGRRQPIGYTGRKSLVERAPAINPKLFIPGHYETPCGGCDTISGYDITFNLIRAAHERGEDVLFEGLLLSGDVKRISQLFNDGLPLLVVALDTPLDVCLASVNERRRVKKPYAEDVNPKTTTAKFKGVQSAMRKFKTMGMDCCWANRVNAFQIIKHELRL